MKSSLDLEIEKLLADCGVDDSDVDFSPTIYAKDYDGTPIAGAPIKRTKTPKYAPKSAGEKKDGRGRPQNRTITVSKIDTPEKKLGLVIGASIEKYGQDFINYMYGNNLIEHVFIATDGLSDCSRVRFYLGVNNKNDDHRDKAKGRTNVYERKGVFPIKEFFEVLDNFYYSWDLKKEI